MYCGKGRHLVCLRRAENEPASGASRGGEKIKAGGPLTFAFFEGTTTPKHAVFWGTELRGLQRPGGWDRVLPSLWGPSHCPFSPLHPSDRWRGKREKRKNNIFISNTDRGGGGGKESSLGYL